MTTKLKLFALAAVLIAAGIVLAVWEPGPETECAEDPNVTSGFYDEEKDCPVSIESWERVAEAESGPQWDNIGALAAIVGGVGVAIFGAFKKSKPKA
ncbi:MAG: hypothetical protein ACRDXX_02640 [Stackebrandtia sp.]